MKLTKRQINFLVEYFKDEDPDIDGYIGRYWIPKKVMKAFRKKYPKYYDERYRENKRTD